MKVSTPNYEYTYVSSTGDTWWAGESTDFSSYSNYITGIVRDDTSGLMQKRSTGRIGYSLAEEGGILTISNGNTFVSPEEIAEDGQFAFVGATSDALDETESIRVINNEGKEMACKALKRNWKINISGIKTISLQFKFTPEMIALLAETPKVGLIKNGTEFIPLQYNEETLTMTVDGIEFVTGDVFTVVVDYIDKPQINCTSQKVCLESTVSLSAIPEGGVWTGDGVEGNTFNALTAGLGEHTVVYSLNSMSDSIVFTVEESIEPEVALTSNISETEEWDSVIIEAQTVTGGENPLFQFALDDPEFEYPLDVYSSNNILRLAGYQLSEGRHTIYVRMKTSLPCATAEIATAQINIDKTATGIVITRQLAISCFPNPFDKEINISGLDSNKSYIVNFFSSNGELVNSLVCAAGQTRIEAPQLSEGIYIMQIVERDSREKIAVVQMMKQR